jgi:hypothetical protein
MHLGFAQVTKVDQVRHHTKAILRIQICKLKTHSIVCCPCFDMLLYSEMIWHCVLTRSPFTACRYLLSTDAEEAYLLTAELLGAQ